jgi:hypothetical protein
MSIIPSFNADQLSGESDDGWPVRYEGAEPAVAAFELLRERERETAGAGEIVEEQEA